MQTPAPPHQPTQEMVMAPSVERAAARYWVITSLLLALANAVGWGMVLAMAASLGRIP